MGTATLFRPKPRRANSVTATFRVTVCAAFLCGAAPSLADSLPEPENLPIPLPAIPRTADCDAYATAYADSYRGSGDPTGDIVDRAMGGAVAGGAWAGPGGARRGARAGGALAVLDNLAAYPGGWQALYDMAYQLCRNETSGVTHRPQTLGDPSVRCRSRAGVVGGKPGNGIYAGSGQGACR